jgi:hypothetical protein
MSTKNYNETIGNQTRDLLVCNAVPQPNAPPRAPNIVSIMQLCAKHMVYTFLSCGIPQYKMNRATKL